MATFETYVVESDGVMLDNLLWRRFRRPTPGLVERVLDINPGLAAMGAWLLAGTSIRVPIDQPSAPAVVAVVKLWD